MGRHSISLVVFCMVFGFLIGMAGFLGMAFLGGLVEAPEAEAVSTEPFYATGTERLEAYRCRAGETKQIIMGGVEDGFDPSNEELTNTPDTALNYLQKSGGNGTDKYDDPNPDRMFADQFDIPSRTYHGIIVMALEERSGLKNDGVHLGYMDDRQYSITNQNYFASIANILSNWSKGDGYISSSFDALNTTIILENEKSANEVIGLSHLTLLDAIRSNEDRLFEVHIADDTIVDFVGFAICLEPETNMGRSFSRYSPQGVEATLDFGEEFVSFYNWGTGYEGNTSCSEALPLTCIHDQNLEIPEGFNDLYGMLWSGAHFKFTEAVPGNRFQTEDEADQFCAHQFGENYRSANTKDGSWMGTMVGYGEYPEGHNYYWVGLKDSPHDNCWELRPDYEDLDRLEAVGE